MFPKTCEIRPLFVVIYSAGMAKSTARWRNGVLFSSVLSTVKKLKLVSHIKYFSHDVSVYESYRF